MTTPLSPPRIYRCWVGNPKGTPENKNNCIIEVPDGGRSVLFHQCTIKRGHGPDGLYCKAHAKKLTLGQIYYSTGLRP